MHRYRVTSWLEDCGGIVIRLRLRRRDYVPVCPAGLQYLAFLSLGVYQLSPASPSRYLRFLSLFCASFVSVLVAFSSSSWFSRGKKKIRDDCGCWLIGKGSDVDSGGERPRVREPRVGWERGVRGGKNCIRSNHIRERHRVLRNQLN